MLKKHSLVSVFYNILGEGVGVQISFSRKIPIVLLVRKKMATLICILRFGKWQNYVLSVMNIISSRIRDEDLFNKAGALPIVL